MSQVDVKSKLNTIRSNEKLWEYTYLLILGIVIVRDFLCTTMFDVSWLTLLSKPIYLATFGYSVCKILFYSAEDVDKKYKNSERLFGVIICISFVFAAIISGYHFLWELAFLIVGAKGIEIEKLLKLYVALGTMIMLITFTSSKLGLIENLVYWGGEKGYRNSFGIIYPTDFSAHILFLFMAWCCIEERKKKFINVAVGTILTIFIYKETAALTGTVCMFIFTFSLLINQLLLQSSWGKCEINSKIKVFFESLLVASPIFFATSYFIIVANYIKGNSLAVKLNQILTIRFSLGAEGLERYGIKLWGQFVEEVGNGGNIQNPEKYFFLDDSYIRILLEYGSITFVLVMIIMILMGKKVVKNKRYIMMIALIICYLDCFMEQHMTEICYNIFIVLCFADMKLIKNNRIASIN